MARLIIVTSKPESSQKPIASVIARTKPKGAKPVKFLTILLNNHSTPALEKRFCEATSLPFAGFVRVVPVAVKTAPRIAIITNKIQNK